MNNIDFNEIHFHTQIIQRMVPHITCDQTTTTMILPQADINVTQLLQWHAVKSAV